MPETEFTDIVIFRQKLLKFLQGVNNDKNNLFSVKPNWFFSFTTDPMNQQKIREVEFRQLMSCFFWEGGRVGSWLKQTRLQIHWTLLLFTQWVVPNNRWNNVRHFAIISVLIRNTKGTNFTSLIDIAVFFKCNGNSVNSMNSSNLTKSMVRNNLKILSVISGLVLGR